MKPMTDLCHVCQQNATALLRAANTAEEDKSEVCSAFSLCNIITFNIQLVKSAQDYLAQATKKLHAGQVEKSSKEIDRVFVEADGALSVPPIGSSPTPCSKTITVHFSFDFAQQVS